MDSIHATLLITVFAVISILGRGQEYQENQEAAIPLTNNEFDIQGGYVYKSFENVVEDTGPQSSGNLEIDQSYLTTEAAAQGEFIYPLEMAAESNFYQAADDTIKANDAVEGHGYGTDEGSMAGQDYQPTVDIIGEINPNIAMEEHGFYPIETVIEDHTNQAPADATQSYEWLSESLDSLAFDYQMAGDPRQEFEYEILKDDLQEGDAETFSPLSDNFIISESSYVDETALFFQTFVPTTFPTVTEDHFEDERLVEYRKHVRRYLAELGEEGFDPQKHVTLSSGDASKEKVSSSSKNEKKVSKDSDGLIRNIFNAVGHNSMRIMLHIIGMFDHLLHKES